MMVRKPFQFRLTVSNAALLLYHSAYTTEQARALADADERGRMPAPRRLWCGEESYCSEAKCECRLAGWPESTFGFRWAA